MTSSPQAPTTPPPFSSRARGNAETLARLASFLSPYKGRIVVNIGCAVLSLSSALAFPQITQYIIDSALGRHDSRTLLVGVAGLVVAFLLRDIFAALHTRVSNSFEQLVIYELRGKVYRHLQQLPIPYFDGMSSGDLLTRVLDDVTDVARLLVDGTEQGAISIATITVVVAILFFKDPSLAAFSLIPLPFVIVSSAWFTVAAHERLRTKRRSLSALSATLLDSLQGIRQIKTFDQDDDDLRRFDRHAESFRQASMKVLNLWAIYVPTMAFLTSLGTVLAWGIGGLSVVRNELTLGELISFIFYLTMLYAPVINIHGLNSLVQAARAAGERLFDILDERAEDHDWPGKTALTAAVQGDVRFDHVSFGYHPGHPVLAGVSLHARPSQTIALIGPTGSGKTTIVSLLLGFYRPEAGRILIDGHDIQDLTLPSLRRQISVVSQQNYLFGGTVRDNIAYGNPSASPQQILAASEAAHCHAFVGALPHGYDTYVGEHGVRLSGGEKQRIGIARAILKKAPILILDEATASVDSQTERLVQDALSRLSATSTTFIIAHRLSTIRHADLIYLLDAGAIVESGSHGDLIARGGAYAALWADQAFAGPSQPQQDRERSWPSI